MQIICHSRREGSAFRGLLASTRPHKNSAGRETRVSDPAEILIGRHRSCSLLSDFSHHTSALSWHVFWPILACPSSEAWKGFWLSAEGEAPWASQRTALCQPSASSAAASSSSADDGLSVDDALLLAGGFGRAQRRLMFTMCFYYGLGSTVTLLPVFLLRPPCDVVRWIEGEIRP